MRKNYSFAGVLLVLLITVLYSCRDEAEFSPISPEVKVEAFDQVPGVMPDATVDFQEFVPNASPFMTGGCAESISPSTFSGSLQEGETAMQSLSACVGGFPPVGDVIFAMDLTGSMYQELNNLKVNSVNIMNSIRANIPDSRFGVVSFQDYPGIYASCGGYRTNYGISTDIPYSLDQAFTDDVSAVQAAINGLSIGNGGDGPESSSRALFETYSDPAMDWRDGAAKIVILITDERPHDCNIPAPFGTAAGMDPGRDQIIGSADDIVMDDVINEFQARGITLITLSSHPHTALEQVWSHYSDATGGSAFKIGYDGTIPNGQAIEDLITDLIEESVATVGEMKFTTTPGYEDWLASSTPVSYSNIELDVVQDLDFDIELTVPAGAADGMHSFEIMLEGDGVVYGTQTIEINVYSDSDGDGCNDDEDPFPNSNQDENIVIDGCDSGVANLPLGEDGCATMMDLILECADNATTHGDFTSCVTGLTNQWKADGLITGREKGQIQRCAAQSSWPN